MCQSENWHKGVAFPSAIGYLMEVISWSRSIAPKQMKPMFTIDCPATGEVIEAYPACNAAPGCPRGLYWEMAFQGDEEIFDIYLTKDLFDFIREAVAPIA